MLETIIGYVIGAVGVAAIGALVAWVKSLKWVKKLGLENLIDSLAESACHWAENFGKSAELKGKAKMAEAKVEFVKMLEKQGIRMTDTEIDVRLAAIFNKFKDVIENK